LIVALYPFFVRTLGG